MQLLAISGSLRAVSTHHALIEAASLLAPPGVEVIAYRGLATLPHFNPDLDGEGATPPAPVAALREAIGRAGALLIVSPEYAHGIPGTLKNALDWLVSSVEFPGIATGAVNASLGSHHAQDALLEVLKTMSARVVAEAWVRIPVTDRRMDAARLAADPGIGEALRGVLAALAAGAREVR